MHTFIQDCFLLKKKVHQKKRGGGGEGRAPRATPLATPLHSFISHNPQGTNKLIIFILQLTKREERRCNVGVLRRSARLYNRLLGGCVQILSMSRRVTSMIHPVKIPVEKVTKKNKQKQQQIDTAETNCFQM